MFSSQRLTRTDQQSLVSLQSLEALKTTQEELIEILSLLMPLKSPRVELGRCPCGASAPTGTSHTSSSP